MTMVSEQPSISPLETKTELVEPTRDVVYYFHLVTFEVSHNLKLNYY